MKAMHMDNTILDAIPYTVDLPDLMKKLHIKPGSPNAAELQAMAAQAQAVARPKAVYNIAFIDSHEEDRVVIDGVAFTSRVLRTNLAQLHRVFPFIATCGAELDVWSHQHTDMLSRFWADAIAEAALRQAMKFLDARLSGLYLPAPADPAEEGDKPRLAEMNPGSLEEWPISEQKPLFALLGNGNQEIGVELSDTFLMRPIKSVSGIYFINREGYTNCQLCPREVCPGRQAPYEPGLFEKKYAGVKR
jgi:hypothetical protein